MTPALDSIAWDHAAREIDHRCAMDAAMLARALRAMGLVREFSMSRGYVPGWAPPYERFTRWRIRFASCGSVQARGWRAGDWSAEAEAAMDAADDRARAAAAERNRRRKEATVFVLTQASLPDRDARRDRRAAALDGFGVAIKAWFRTPPAARGPRPVLSIDGDLPAQPIYLELGSFAWRDHTGAAFGDGLAALAAFAWRLTRGRATARLARVVGVELVGTRDLDRRMAAIDVEARARVAA
jgi:hypothetical protein